MPVEVAYLCVVPLAFAVISLVLLLRIEVCRLSNVDALAALRDQFVKAKDEIVARIAGLEAANAAGEDLTAQIADLSAVAQALDDVVPDAPAEG